MIGNEERKNMQRKENALKCKEMLGDESRNNKNIINNDNNDDCYCYL